MSLTESTVSEATRPPADRSRLPELVVTPLSYWIGSEIRGVDLRRPLAPETVEAIRQIWLDRKVVFFPDQHLTPEEHLAFARQFGEPTEGHPVVPGLDGLPNVFEIDYSFAAETYKHYGDIADRDDWQVSWHTDVTFVKRPPLGSILRAVTIPPSGGDTWFSNQVAAFEALSPALRAWLETLEAEHDGEAQFKPILDAVGAGTWEGERFERLEPSVHPVVRVIPETGEKALFVNPGFTKRIVGLRKAESDTLLKFLFEHSVRPEFTVRYHWTEGTIGFWDNRATQHAVTNDIAGQPRRIQRVTLRGDEPVGVRA